MKIIEEKENQMKFTAEIEESLANAMRRYINQISILALDEIEISKNDSPLYDETIAHRIGLIPLKMEKNANEKTEISLKLTFKKEGFIFSEELKGAVKIVYDKIPITFLKEKEEMEITAIAKLGKGVNHSKFSPGLMFYQNVVEIKIDKDCPEEVIGVCPKNILKLENGKIVAKEEVKCDMCEACIECLIKKKKESIKLIPTNELMITLESFGQIEIKEMIKKSIEELKKDLSDITKKVK